MVLASLQKDGTGSNTVAVTVAEHVTKFTGFPTSVATNTTGCKGVKEEVKQQKIKNPCLNT